MTKIVLKYGLISGAVLAAFAAILTPIFCLNGSIDVQHSEIFGYTAMILAYLWVFFGIRSYRENMSGGTITFGKAFQVGILITLVVCAVYVISWEIVYYNFLPDFADRYATLTIAKMRAHGATAAAIQKAEQEMADFKRMYADPLINVALTFLEVFPVGLVMTVISAVILRKKRDGAVSAALSSAR